MVQLLPQDYFICSACRLSSKILKSKMYIKNIFRIFTIKAIERNISLFKSKETKD